QLLHGADALRGVLENPMLDKTLQEIFDTGAMSPQTPQTPAPEGQRRTLEVVPPGWHGQV
ncbi:hypothetical protein, partial [Vibrio parahaemolyticus]